MTKLSDMTHSITDAIKKVAGRLTGREPDHKQDDPSAKGSSMPHQK
jgi:hypothetical protein